MGRGPDEILPGVFHWTARHPQIATDVSSYLLSGPRVLLDPMLPPGGLDWLRAQGEPAEIVLSNRHHTRETETIVAAFDCPLRVPRCTSRPARRSRARTGSSASIPPDRFSS